MKKNGRPELDENLKRKAHFVKGYCTKEQKEKIISLAKENGLTVSDYILKKCLNERTVERRIQLIDSLDTINLEISKIGNNINQLAKHANRKKNVDGLDKELFMNFTFLLNDYLKKINDLKTSIKSIYRELAKR